MVENEQRLRQAARTLRLPVTLVDDLDDADVLMTLKSYYRKHPQPITTAERLGKPVYVLRSNTVILMEACLADIGGRSDVAALGPGRPLEFDEDGYLRD